MRENFLRIFWGFNISDFWEYKVKVWVPNTGEDAAPSDDTDLNWTAFRLESKKEGEV